LSILKLIWSISRLKITEMTSAQSHQDYEEKNHCKGELLWGDPSSLRLWCIKKAEESSTRVDSLASLKLYSLSE